MDHDDDLFKSIFYASHMNMRLSELFSGLEFFITRKYIRSYDVTRRGLNELVNDVSRKQIKDLVLENVDFNLQERSSFKFKKPNTFIAQNEEPSLGYDNFLEDVTFEEESYSE